MTTAVSSSYQDSTDHCGMFFLRPVCATRSALDIQSGFTKEGNHFSKIHFYCFQLPDDISNYMTMSCKTGVELPQDYSLAFSHFYFSLMTICFWIYLIGFEMVS